MPSPGWHPHGEKLAYEFAFVWPDGFQKQHSYESEFATPEWRQLLICGAHLLPSRAALHSYFRRFHDLRYLAFRPDGPRVPIADLMYLSLIPPPVHLNRIILRDREGSPALHVGSVVSWTSGTSTQFGILFNRFDRSNSVLVIQRHNTGNDTTFHLCHILNLQCIQTTYDLPPRVFAPGRFGAFPDFENYTSNPDDSPVLFLPDLIELLD